MGSCANSFCVCLCVVAQYSSFYQGSVFTSFDTVYFRFDSSLVNFKLLNFVIDVLSFMFDMAFILSC